MHLVIASSNPGKLRDFAAAAAPHGVEMQLLPDFKQIPEAIEDGATFEENARKKAEHYSRRAAGRFVIADDSGLEVDALGGAPGVYSARYAARTGHAGNSSDDSNNSRLVRELAEVDDAARTARFVCVISVARDGVEVAQFRGTAEGMILRELRGSGGFGYDPLFYFPSLGKTFAELSPDEKAKVSHRGKAFEELLRWCDSNP